MDGGISLEEKKPMVDHKSEYRWFKPLNSNQIPVK
jgi:hypothetical protein